MTTRRAAGRPRPAIQQAPAACRRTGTGLAREAIRTKAPPAARAVLARAVQARVGQARVVLARVVLAKVVLAKVVLARVELARVVVELVALHGADEADVVGNGGGVGQQVA